MDDQHAPAFGFRLRAFQEFSSNRFGSAGDVYHLGGPTVLKTDLTTSMFGRCLWVRSAIDEVLIPTC